MQGCCRCPSESWHAGLLIGLVGGAALAVLGLYAYQAFSPTPETKSCETQTDVVLPEKSKDPTRKAKASGTLMPKWRQFALVLIAKQKEQQKHARAVANWVKLVEGLQSRSQDL